MDNLLDDLASSATLLYRLKDLQKENLPRLADGEIERLVKGFSLAKKEMEDECKRLLPIKCQSVWWVMSLWKSQESGVPREGDLVLRLKAFYNALCLAKTDQSEILDVALKLTEFKPESLT